MDEGAEIHADRFEVADHLGLSDRHQKLGGCEFKITFSMLPSVCLYAKLDHRAEFVENLKRPKAASPSFFEIVMQSASLSQ